MSEIEKARKNRWPIRTPQERFMEKVSPEPMSGCWIWTSTFNSSGYGWFRYEGKMKAAHRISYLFFKGEDPGRLLVMHKCDMPLCVNPHHLSLGTDKDNCRDRDLKGRNGFSKRTHCPSGHEYSVENTHHAYNAKTNKRGRICRICANKAAIKSRNKKLGRI